MSLTGFREITGLRDVGHYTQQYIFPLEHTLKGLLADQHVTFFLN